jgi:hypothetical protein
VAEGKSHMARINVSRLFFMCFAFR